MVAIVPLDKDHNVVPLEKARNCMVIDDPDHPDPYMIAIEPGYVPPPGVEVIKPEEEE